MGIQFYGVKITNETDKMYRVFSEIYEEVTMKKIEVANLGYSSKSLSFFILCSVI